MCKHSTKIHLILEIRFFIVDVVIFVVFVVAVIDVAAVVIIVVITAHVVVLVAGFITAFFLNPHTYLKSVICSDVALLGLFLSSIFSLPYATAGVRTHVSQ